MLEKKWLKLVSLNWRYHFYRFPDHLGLQFPWFHIPPFWYSIYFLLLPNICNHCRFWDSDDFESRIIFIYARIHVYFEIRKTGNRTIFWGCKAPPFDCKILKWKWNIFYDIMLMLGQFLIAKSDHFSQSHKNQQRKEFTFQNGRIKITKLFL